MSAFERFCPMCDGFGTLNGEPETLMGDRDIPSCRSCQGKGFVTPWPRARLIGGGRIYPIVDGWSRDPDPGALA